MISFRRVRLPGLALVLLAVTLTGCETEKIQQTRLGIQQNLFLQSVELVENAGSLLQKPQLQQADIDLAMQQMDEGLRQAYQVEDSFLRMLDPGLQRQYADNFISGVETYRIGVEASSRDQQLQGLDRLGKWARFWSGNKPDIQRKMVAITGLPLQSG